MAGEQPVYRRVLLKLSGEALMGDRGHGIDPQFVAGVARDIVELVEAGVQLSLVVGGGNIFRGTGLAAGGMGRVTADQIGMLATVMNALALQDYIQHSGLDARVMSAVGVSGICDQFDRRQAVRHLDKGRVVVFAAGTGNPFFTTDSAASLRAIEIGADLMIKATKVDGVFSADPLTFADAQRFERLDYDEVLSRKLGVMDATAVVLCREHDLRVRVVSLLKPGSLLNAAMGGDEGTLVARVSDGRSA